MDVPTTDWTHPGESIEVPVDKAAADMPFPVYVPKGLGDFIVYETSDGTPIGDQAVTFVFSDSSEGTFWFGEGVPTIPGDAARKKWYAQVVSENGTPYRNVTASIVQIRDGVPALLGVQSDDGVALVRWVENGVEYVVRGPSLTADQALKIANVA